MFIAGTGHSFLDNGHKRGDSHGIGTGHDLSCSAHDDKPEQTDKGDNER